MRRLSLIVLLLCTSTARARPPNVLIVITDDQGYGDLGAHGNPVIRTPALDAFAKQSVWLKNFYVCPVCSPTRSSLLTGQYNYRTGIVDTFIGRSLMRPDVKTLPEYLATAGYRTGLFGKWHLGDNYPLRPEDRGFQETLWSAGGGIAQPSDPPGGNSYFDPILKKNGKEVKTKGYCTDVFTDGAIGFMTAESKKPFFAYVAYNCPHGPYQVADELAAPYHKRDLTADGFPKVGQPWAGPKLNTEEIAKAYGMIENIDTNFARMMKALADKGIADNTIVIFLTDNGPGGVRWNGGLRNRKGTVYEGGIRVPCYVRWPAGADRVPPVDVPLAHIDITPTVLAACGVRLPVDTNFDGRDFTRFLRWGPQDRSLRTLFFQWHRGDVPEKYRAFAARDDRFKLVQANGVAPNAKWTPKYELFDIAADPFEQKDLAADKPDEVARLKSEYETWFADVTKLGFDPPRIVVGNAKENPVRLSRQDWRGPKAGWEATSEGHWDIHVERAGTYKLTLRSKSEFNRYEYSAGTAETTGSFEGEGEKLVTQTIPLGKGDARVSGRVQTGGKPRGFDYVELEFIKP